MPPSRGKVGIVRRARGPADGDYDESVGGLGETGWSARIGEADDRIGVTLGGARGARGDDERDEVGRRTGPQGNVAAEELEAPQDRLFRVRPRAGRPGGGAGGPPP